MHKLECLGVIEDNLNSLSAGPLAWELVVARRGRWPRAHLAAELDDLIIEHVTPTSEGHAGDEQHALHDP